MQLAFRGEKSDLNFPWEISILIGTTTCTKYNCLPFLLPSDNWNYTTVIERRSLLRETAANAAVEITPVIPLADYNVQVNASNTRSFILSNVVPLTMPPGCMSTWIFFVNFAGEFYFCIHEETVRKMRECHSIVCQ